MRKLFKNAPISIESGILESPIPLHAIFGLAEEAPREPKCDYDIL